MMKPVETSFPCTFGDSMKGLSLLNPLSVTVLCFFWAIRTAVFSDAMVCLAQDPLVGPQDLELAFRSPFDGTQQPYRLYLPSSYDGLAELPLLVALHGTGGDQNKYFDHVDYGNGIYKTEAEKRGIALLCPLGTDAQGLPTEWRGEAEINVFAVLEEVQRRFRIDSQRIVCTGQSMGGTGTTYLCCRYPDLFAAGIPLASTYGHVSLVANLRHVPMFFVQGGNDWPIYAATGPIPLTQEMKRLGYAGDLWMIPDAGHNTFAASTPRVLDWALQQRRVSQPTHITHRAYFPPHGRAWWVDIQQIERPGWYAEVDARVIEGNRVIVIPKNTRQLVLRPDPMLYDSERPLRIAVEDRDVFSGLCNDSKEVLLVRENAVWTAKTQPRQNPSRTQWKNFIMGTVDQPPTFEGTSETTLGNWLADAMRDISGADIAICTKGHYRIGEKMRGQTIQPGQTLHLMQWINWLRPGDAALATVKLSGSDLLKIIEMNLLDGPRDDMFLVQVSGCRYTFDRKRPQGNRVVDTDIQPDRQYTAVFNSFDLTRSDTLRLGEYFGKLDHQTLEPNLLSAAWAFTVKNGGRVSARLDGRVIEIK
jgi:predicted esterase